MAIRKCTVSIVIPVKNEEKTLKKCLDSVFGQLTIFKYDVLVIDSGSIDQSIRIARSYPSVKIVQIKPEEFGHGKTRNLGGERTSGDFIVWLNGDAVPSNQDWLDALIKPMIQDKNVAGVYSRHEPGRNCHLYMVRDLNRSMPSQKIIKIKAKKNDMLLFSTVSCAVRREIWRQLPFENEIDIAEDYHWGRMILNNGFKIVYQPASAVLHSHNYTPGQLYRIKHRISRVQKPFRSKSTAFVAGFFVFSTAVAVKFSADFAYIITRKIPLARKFSQIRISFLARLFSFCGRFMGGL